MDTLIALRPYRDGLKQCCSVSKFKNVSNFLSHKNVSAAVHGARSQYENDLKDKQSSDKEAEKRKIQKRIIVTAAKFRRSWARRSSSTTTG